MSIHTIIMIKSLHVSFVPSWRPLLVDISQSWIDVTRRFAWPIMKMMELVFSDEEVTG